MLPPPPHPASATAAGNATSLTLIERVRVRDEDAWGRLVLLYSPLLRHWCRRWGVRGDDVEDVVQEVFQVVAAGLENFRRDREGDSFRGWLRGVARNKAMDLFRRRGSRGQGGTGSYRLSLQIPGPDPGPDDAEGDDAEGEVVGALFRRALDLVRGEFEGRTWQAFWRSAVEGQPPAAIAEDLGVSAAAVRQSKSRVLRRLKDVLGEPPR